MELPKIGANLESRQTYGSIESVKAVSDLCAPVSGEVVEINSVLSDTPELLNKDPHEAAWLLKIRLSDPQEASALMEASAYEKYTAEIASEPSARELRRKKRGATFHVAPRQ